MVDVGCSAGLNLTVDRVGITYSNGQSLGDKTSPVQLSASIVGGRPVPTSLIPEVVSRIGIDRDPIDVTDPDDVRWLHACLSPDHPNRPEREARLDAEIALAASDPPALLGGDPVELLHDAFALIPPGALPVVITTWALSRFSVERRRRFWSRLADAAAQRPLAWVSAEGVGVAPSIPTFGDRPASGHSIIGVAVLGRRVPGGKSVQAVGRCWSRGRLLAWLAEG